MDRAWLVAALALVLVTTGCLGSAQAAHVPAEDAEAKGWEETGSTSETVAMGLAEKKSRDYAPSSGTPRAGVTVVSATDVPLFDESRFIPDAIERLEQQYGVDFEESGTTQLQLANLDATVTATVYDVKGGPSEAQAVLFEAPCSSFVVTAAWGTTGSGGGGGLFGGSSDGESYYEQAKDVARHVTC